FLLNGLRVSLSFEALLYSPYMRNPFILCLAGLFLSGFVVLSAENAAPDSAFDLSNWKLQIPGPRDIKDLKKYSSEYFYLNPEKEMCFHLDASEKGSTKNSHYVRTELRHLPEWNVTERHILSGEFRVISQLSPNKVTVLQIHGIEDDGGKAPPLLRIA